MTAARVLYLTFAFCCANAAAKGSYWWGVDEIPTTERNSTFDYPDYGSRWESSKSSSHYYHGRNSSRDSPYHGVRRESSTPASHYYYGRNSTRVPPYSVTLPYWLTSASTLASARSSTANIPYYDKYNVTNLSPIQRVVNLGSTINVEVTSSGDVDVCMYTMPSGFSSGFRDPDRGIGVSFINDYDGTCRISIGPITEALLGPWLLIGKFSNYTDDIFTEKIQYFTITQKETNNWGRYTSHYSRSTRPPSAGTRHNYGTPSWDRRLTTPTPYLGHFPSQVTPEYERWREERNSTRGYGTESDRVVVEIPRSLATDQDVHFALSLVPMLRARTPRDKLATHIDILTYLRSKHASDKK